MAQSFPSVSDPPPPSICRVLLLLLLLLLFCHLVLEKLQMPRNGA